MTLFKKVALGVPTFRSWGQIDIAPLVEVVGRGRVVVRLYPPGATTSDRRALGALFFLRSTLGAVIGAVGVYLPLGLHRWALGDCGCCGPGNRRGVACAAYPVGATV